MDLRQRFANGLAKTRKNLLQALALGKGERLTGAAQEELEEALLLADVGVRVTEQIVHAVREEGMSRLHEVVLGLLGEPQPLQWATHGPTCWLLCGVNGAGKTTTAGKLAYRYGRSGKKVLLAAGDTFRAAAADQLAVWAERADAELIRRPPGSDPASVAFDAAAAAKARHHDLLLVDTAGRLHTKDNLMAELGKMQRAVGKELPGAPHEVLLTVDASFGQNALEQARAFLRTTAVTGLCVTKLDGTAKAGIILAIRQELGIPVKLVGLGEGVEDLVDFDPGLYAAGLLPNPA